MRKHLTDHRMNCLQCCLAGMFDLELEEVPGAHAWAKSHDYWFAGMYEWSKKKLNHIPIAVTDDTLDDLFHIAMTETPEGQLHAVIAYGTKIVWDPTPTSEVEDLSNATYSLVFVPTGGLSVQKACLMSFVSDWAQEASKSIGEKLNKEIKNG